MRSDQQGGSAMRQFSTVVAAVVAGYLLAQLAVHALDPNVGVWVVTLVEASTLAVFAATAVWWAIIRQLRAQSRDQQFAATLHSALQMASTESATYAVVDRALRSADIAGRTRLLVADSSEAHLKPALDTGAGNGPCTVVAPFDCPAIRRAQPSEFRDVAALDTCPWLAAAHPRGAAGQGALCVPLNVVGRAIGVLQIAAPTSSLPTGSQTRAVEAIAEHAGTRIGMLRVLETTSLQAATDPLTGLLNRRSLENQAGELFRSDAPFALAMGDLDHFKQLNDTFGHDTGDRALRVFARTVRSVLRSEDLISRYGGEEFVIVFPAQSSSTAAGALERVREALALAAVAGSVPAFTASFGVASSVDAQSLDELIKSADAALFQSKHDGRNRVTIAGIANHHEGAESFPGSDG